MRFIFNFILYGVLFYAIYLAFPEAFMKMVGWAHSIYEFVRDIVIQLFNKLQEFRGSKAEPVTAPQHALFLMPLWISYFIRR